METLRYDPGIVNMHGLVRLSIVGALLSLAGCGGDRDPSTPAPPSAGGETITGRERLGWTQPAENPADLTAYRYALYVDGQRRVLEGEACAPSAAGGGFDCSAPLPALGAGRHTLEVAAFITSGDTVLEGPRSPVLQVNVAGATAPAGSAVVESGPLVSSDGLRMHAEILASDLADPVDLAVAPDGRVFVAERNGALRLVDTGRLAPVQQEPGNVLEALREEPASGTAALLSVALPADFTRSGQLHIAYITMDGDQPALRLARLRESGGALGQAAVLASFAVAAQDVSAILRFGPDENQYVAIGTGSNADDAQNVAAATGKILRLRADGSTPEDNPSSSPVFSLGHRDPRGLAWLPGDNSLWEVERGERGDELNRIVAGGNYGWPVAGSDSSYPGATPPALTLPPAKISGIASMPRSSSPLVGDLIVSSADARDLFRVRRGGGRLRVGGRFLQGRFGRIAQIAIAPDGAIYLITANQDEWGPGHDLLLRIVPES